MKADWSRYYRQALRAIWMCWLQASMGSSAGVSIDFRLVFGDASNPNSMNWVQNILIWIARWLVGREWNLDEAAPETWTATVLQQPWAKGRAREWMQHRWQHFGTPSADKGRVENVQLLFQAVPMALVGFFDDAMSGGKRGVCTQFERALGRLRDELGIEQSLPKSMLADIDGTLQLRTGANGEWSQPEPGHPDILGKEFVLRRRVRRDTGIRIKVTCALLDMIVEQAQRNGRMIPTAAARRACGQSNFITDQHPQHRCFLSGLTVSIGRTGTETAAKRGADKQQRTTAMARAAYMRAHAQPGWNAAETTVSSEGDMPTSGMGPQTYLAASADDELRAMKEAMLNYNEEAFLPRRSPPGRDAIFIMQDSAGLMRDDDDVEVEPQPGRAGAAWFYSEGWDSIPCGNPP